MTPDHKALRRQYIEELREAKKLAEEWWQNLVGAELDESWVAAVAEVHRRWPGGPVSHPYVIGTIVKHIRACDALNRTLDRSDRVPVNQFVIDALDGTDTQDLVTFTNSLSYWPIGLGEDGRPV
jgi:hypothetical protein